MIIRDLLLALNQKSIKQNIKYLLEYTYQFNPAKNRIFQRTMIVKFGWGKKVLASTQVFSDIEIISYLNQELQTYK